ncbi:MAG: NACHT domain-containing protein [Sphingomonadales bacterium]|nr:NACHT domain-containing protein [Sphingomonadales bacterium]
MDDAEGHEGFGEKHGIDKIRASKAGHAYHEAWAARSALELLPPSTSLTAITLEGFAVEDELGLSTSATEIADLVRYYGSHEASHATRIEVVQFKYSIASAEVPLRAADLAKTLKKFAQTDFQFRQRHGDAYTEAVISYEFSTNRPIHPNLYTAVEALISGVSGDNDVAIQQDQIQKAIAGYSFTASSLLQRLMLFGNGGSLSRVEKSVRQVIADWSEATDPDSEKRLLKLRNLIRNKAGPDGSGDNRIDRIAVLAELEVDHEARLYPVPDAFAPVEHVVDRAIVAEIVDLSRADSLPLVIHAAGGMGKTVLMQSIAEHFRSTNHVVTFDGFGAGKWRDPADGRHRPERTLIHFANLLAGQGLCDILLPINDITSLMRAFRGRLQQAVTTTRRKAEGARVVLILDAIDHAAMAAADTGSLSFAHLLLQSLSVDPIDGVTLICSCRTERLQLAVGGAEHRVLAVPPFSPEEAKALILARDPTATPVEISVLGARSGRNPRCLDTLLITGRPYDVGLASSEQEASPIEVLDALLKKRIEDTRKAARSRGTTNVDIDILLSGLSILPPPVPIEELAVAHNIPQAQVESFAADLAPLLERTPYGLMFRDEPTETLIRSMTSKNHASHERIISELDKRQSLSNYAARAFPAVLMGLNYTDKLVELAFDERVPTGASKVSQRDIRLARITSALEACARSHRHDDLIRLLLEVSIVAAGHERSDRFLYEYPDLVAVAKDSEALRRLFATKAGWPGGRHAALAIAYIFSDDFDEARRNARRAIDWYNWSVKQTQHPMLTASQVSTAWDDIGFTYVEMLAGNDRRVAQFFGRRNEGEAYQKFCDLLDLLERQAILSSDRTALDCIHRKIRNCRPVSRALCLAALDYSIGDPIHDRKLIERLVDAEAAKQSGDTPKLAILAAAARATSLGMRREARIILEKDVFTPPSIYDFSSYWPADRDNERAVILAGIRASLRGTPPTLRDLAPRELIELVPDSVQARGPKAFKQYIDNFLAEQPISSKRKKKSRKGKKIDYEKRTNIKRAIQYRIEPLVVMAGRLIPLLSLPNGTTRSEAAISALNALEGDVERVSNYPYRDGKAYIARVGFLSLFAIADVVGTIDREVSRKMVVWLKSTPGMSTIQLTAITMRLSRIPACQDATLELAAYIEKLILLDTDTSLRISAYGDLARAVWRVDAEEAAAYFRRALDLADAIGSNDFDRTNHLLELASQYNGPPLPGSVGHDLARILELNQSEASRFPWIEYGLAMVPVSGAATLANLARLDDRGKAQLDLSLGPVLTILISSGKMPPDLGVCAFGLAAPSESLTWRYPAFVKAALAHLPPRQHEWLFDIILIELDRADQLSPWKETVLDLLVLAQAHLCQESPALARINALAELKGAQDTGVPSPMKEYEPQVGDVNLADPNAIDAAIEQEGVDQSGHRWPERTLLRLAGQASTPTERLNFVKAVVHSSVPKLSEKLRALDDYLPAWSDRSAAMRDSLPTLALVLANKHAQELVGHSWEASAIWQKLIGIFGGNRSEIIGRVIMSLRAIATEVNGDSWLLLAAKVAPIATPGALADGLKRFLSLTGATLPDEVGDGPWKNSFIVNDEPGEVIAGLIWSRLGHMKAAMRWRAAHAVRRLADVNRFDVLVKIVAHFDKQTALPYSDGKFPFYHFHAQLWLLIALARVAKDHAKDILPFRPLLERVAFNESFPHIVMCAFAADALQSLIPLLNDVDGKDLLEKVKLVNHSPFPRQQRESTAKEFWQNRPEGSPEPKNQFHLDYDFYKNQINRLSDVFNCSGWEINDTITRWVRDWDSSVQGMYDCPRSSNEDYREDSWSSGYTPEQDRYGGYLGWHALMLTAGEMLASHPIVDRRWGGDAWIHFLQSYTLSRLDGLWLADATDLFPLDVSVKLPMPKIDLRKTDPEDYRLLAQFFGLQGGVASAEQIVVSGSWLLPDDVTLIVQTILADRRDAEVTALTLLTDEKFFRWLPHNANDVERHFGVNGHSVRAWIDSVENSDRQIDRHDPYACSTAMRRPMLADWLREKYDILPGDKIPRRWFSGNKLIAVSEAWGVETGYREHRWDHNGERIYIPQQQLLSLLKNEQKSIVFNVKAQKYFRDKAERKAGDTNAFTHRSLVFVLDGNGRMWMPTRISYKTKSVIDALSMQENTEFRARFQAIREVRRRLS